jgi:hypothetical protein
MVSKESAAKRLGNVASLTSRRKAAKATVLPTSTDEQVEFAAAHQRRPKETSRESPEEREERLAARKARTLKAFQTTYENRRRKAS